MARYRLALASPLMAVVVLALCGEGAEASKSPKGTLTLVAAAQSGLMSDIGYLNPHAYRPNEFIANNWVYEGLVRYGEGGQIKPSLAESWAIDTRASGEMVITFALRKNVRFHDGAPWDAEACKVNFDNLFVEPLKSGYHGWFDLPKRTKSWNVVDQYTFQLVLDAPYYPAMQDLSLIRPIRFISPRHLHANPKMKSCPMTTPVSWNTSVTAGSQFTCNGTRGVAGTGPWVFDRKITTQREIDATLIWDVATSALQPGEKLVEARFNRFTDHWDTTAGGNIQKLVVKISDSVAAVAPAVAAGDVDMVFGLDTVDPQAFKSLHLVDDDQLQTYISGPLSTRVLIFNTAKFPTDSLGVRKAIINSVNKLSIIRRELAGLEQPAYAVFPRNAPYADIDLSPAHGYDQEKARMILNSLGWVVPASGGTRQKDGKPLVRLV